MNRSWRNGAFLFVALSTPFPSFADTAPAPEDFMMKAGACLSNHAVLVTTAYDFSTLQASKRPEVVGLLVKACRKVMVLEEGKLGAGVRSTDLDSRLTLSADRVLADLEKRDMALKQKRVPGREKGDDRVLKRVSCYAQLSNAMLEDLTTRFPEEFIARISLTGGAYGIANDAQKRCDENILPKTLGAMPPLASEATDYAEGVKMKWFNYVQALAWLLEPAIREYRAKFPSTVPLGQ